MKQFFAILIFVSLANAGLSQEERWLTFPAKVNDTLVLDTSQRASLNYEVEDGELNIHKDDRIEGLKSFVKSGEERLDGVLIDGYRVMIYFDQDKTKSEQQKAHFISMYDEHPAYVDYVAPNYRVRVGNFRTKLEAEKLKQEILVLFPKAIVVADKIQLPPINGEKAEGTPNGE